MSEPRHLSEYHWNAADDLDEVVVKRPAADNIADLGRVAEELNKASAQLLVIQMELYAWKRTLEALEG